jgi:hypothetical protein
MPIQIRSSLTVRHPALARDDQINRQTVNVLG